MNDLKRMALWLKSLAAPVHLVTPNDSASPLNIDPAWHGDHWQNLLSCPMMDARHYVMEDWTTPLLREFPPENESRHADESVDDEQIDAKDRRAA